MPLKIMCGWVRLEVFSQLIQWEVQVPRGFSYLFYAAEINIKSYAGICNYGTLRFYFTLLFAVFVCGLHRNWEFNLFETSEIHIVYSSLRSSDGSIVGHVL